MNYIDFFLQNMRIFSVIIINVRKMATSIQCKYDQIDLFNCVFHFHLYKDPHDELKHQNVLITNGDLQATAEKFQLKNLDELKGILAQCHEILFKYRNETRPRPHRDEKFLASWNGLMISGLARAASVLQEPRYTQLAEQAINFIRMHLFDPSTKRLLRTCYIDQKSEQIEYT